jgi:hypothetical protein
MGKGIRVLKYLCTLNRESRKIKEPFRQAPPSRKPAAKDTAGFSQKILLKEKL